MRLILILLYDDIGKQKLILILATNVCISQAFVKNESVNSVHIDLIVASVEIIKLYNSL